MKRNIVEKGKGNGPQVFGDVMQGGFFWKEFGDLNLVKPLATAAIRGDEFGSGLSVGVDVIEEAAVDELLGFDALAAIGFGEEILIGR